MADVAGVAQEVDSGLSTAEFVSAYGNGCMWDRSSSVQGCDQWLPRYVLRVYVAREYEGHVAREHEAQKSAPYWGFFGVYLRPARRELLPEPVASWGVVKQVNPKDPVGWKSAVEVGIAGADPLFLLKTDVENWQSVASGLRPAEFELMEYMAQPVVELKTADAVKCIVVNPLVERLQELKAASALRATAP